MVTAADWSDLDRDGSPELIVTGEWMATRIFGYDKKTNALKEWDGTGLKKMKGWWKSVKAADLNGDGFADLVIGNIGQNFYLRPAAKTPVKLWVADFDKDGKTESFMTRTIDGDRDVPVFLKRETTDQFPVLKKENLRHSDYAGKTIQDLFSSSVLDDARVDEFNYTASVIAMNDGKGHFTVTELPQPVQLSSLNAILVTDINNDLKPDLVLGGNMYTFQPQFGRLDAGFGHVLINDGKGNFSPVRSGQSGLMVEGEIRAIAQLKGSEGAYLLFARNNDTPVLYGMRNPVFKEPFHPK